MNVWDIINIPFGYVLRFCNWLAGNQYILALLIFAFIIEVLMLPFGIKQQKNSIKQAKLRPKEMAIRKKYAGRDDAATRQKITAEIQEMYQKEGFNPMGGCLPMLLQLPIIIALYNIVLNPLHYICGLSADAISQISGIVSNFTAKSYVAERNIELLGDLKNVYASHPNAFANVEGFSEQIQSVGDLPNLNLFGIINLAEIPSLAWNWLLLIPVLTFASYFFSMKMSRKLSFQAAADDPAMGCSNKIMDFMMPAFSVFIAFSVPAAIGVYWIFKSLLGVLKQLIIHFAMPIPKFSEEDYKAAEKAMNIQPPKAPRNKSGKVVRSLHHIDDEDFPDTAETGRARREALEAQQAKETKKETKNVGSLSAAPLKEDKGPKEKDEKEASNAEEESSTDKKD